LRIRLDAELVKRKMARSRDDARELIESGSVIVNGFPAMKVATMVDESTSISLVSERESYVSRGAHKLKGALEYFAIPSFNGKTVLDAGASTGGFTEIALQWGAQDVIAVDVGYGQLAWSLQDHPQVKVFDRTNIRELDQSMIGDKVDVIVADLSFISLTLVLAKFKELLADDGEMFVMVKPQFEVGKALLGAGGVVRESESRAMAVRQVASAAWDLGLGVAGVVASSLPGPSGNVEYFLWLRTEGEELRESDLQQAIKEGPQ
jgi:23S rRNA (cytidine1920-2'-O)/16S rRNA (cytidine1409-2'-O)-methyltransferase